MTPTSLHTKVWRSVGRSLLLPMLVAVAATVGEAQTPQPPLCRGADETSALLIEVLRQWATETDPERISHRDSIYRIPVVPPENIVLETNHAVCVLASKAYAGRVGELLPGPVYVIRLSDGVSTWYLVHARDPEPGGSEFGTYVIFDLLWRYMGGWTG